MIIYKTQEEIEGIAKANKVLAQVLDKVVQQVKPGASTAQLEELATKLIIEQGGRPAFKGYKTSSSDEPFPTTLCTSINNEIVHAPALPGRELKEGDIIGIDIGIEYQGFFGDMAVTVPVGEISGKAKRLLDVTKRSLELAIEQVREGNTVADIGKAVQTYVENMGFSVVRDLVGHGVGKKVHEPPNVPNFVTEESKKVVLKKGMVLALEPMVSTGDWHIKLLDDNFTYATVDGSLSAQFEHTVAIDHQGQTRILSLP